MFSFLSLNRQKYRISCIPRSKPAFQINPFPHILHIKKICLRKSVICSQLSLVTLCISLQKGRSSDLSFFILSHLPGFPVVSVIQTEIKLHSYSGGTVWDSHPFPYYPVENTGTFCNYFFLYGYYPLFQFYWNQTSLSIII